MSAALYRLPPGSLRTARPGEQVLLSGAEGHHAADVRRERAGAWVLLADGSDQLARAQVTVVRPGELTARIAGLEPAGYPGPPLTLVQALAKGGRDLAAVEAATELGADAIIPWAATRCVVTWRGERAGKSWRKWLTTADAAAKQSRRPAPPQVEPLHTSKQLAQAVRAHCGRGGEVLILHEEAAESITGVIAGPEGPGGVAPGGAGTWVVTGPEGGITPGEIEALTAAGGRPVRMGRYVLRSSTAGPAALAVLSAARRWGAPGGAGGTYDETRDDTIENPPAR